MHLVPHLADEWRCSLLSPKQCPCALLRCAASSQGRQGDRSACAGGGDAGVDYVCGGRRLRADADHHAHAGGVAVSRCEASLLLRPELLMIFCKCSRGFLHVQLCALICVVSCETWRWLNHADSQPCIMQSQPGSRQPRSAAGRCCCRRCRRGSSRRRTWSDISPASHASSSQQALLLLFGIAIKFRTYRRIKGF